MTVSDHVAVGGAPAASGQIVRELERTEQGFRAFLVAWRGGSYRVAFKREASFRLGAKKELAPPTLSLVVAPCDDAGVALEEFAPLEKDRLEQLQSIGRQLAAWGGA